jgi:hypothetical protein
VGRLVTWGALWWDGLRVGGFELWDVLRVRRFESRTFWEWEVLSCGTFWEQDVEWWDVLRVGRFERRTFCMCTMAPAGLELKFHLYTSARLTNTAWRLILERWNNACAPCVHACGCIRRDEHTTCVHKVYEVCTYAILAYRHRDVGGLAYSVCAKKSAWLLHCLQGVRWRMTHETFFWPCDSGGGGFHCHLVSNRSMFHYVHTVEWEIRLYKIWLNLTLLNFSSDPMVHCFKFYTMWKGWEREKEDKANILSMFEFQVNMT